MTYDYIVAEVAERMNLSSDTAIARIGRTVNERYKWVRSSIGMQQLVQTTKIANSVTGSREMTFPLEYIQMVYNNTVPAAPFELTEVSIKEMRDTVLITQPPQRFAKLRAHAFGTTIMLDCLATDVFPLWADGFERAIKLQNDMVPDFPEDFHDCLIYYGMEVEYRKMLNSADADKMLAIADRRVSELRFFLAKGGMAIYQAKRRRVWFLPQFQS